MYGCGNRVIYDLLKGLNARIALLRATSMSRAGRRQESLREDGRAFSKPSSKAIREYRPRPLHPPRA